MNTNQSKILLTGKYAEFVKSIDAKSIFCEKALEILLPYRSLTILLHFDFLNKHILRKKCFATYKLQKLYKLLYKSMNINS